MTEETILITNRFCYNSEGGVTEETILVIEQLTLILGTNPT